MDEFVRCPQCDDDLPGEDWEQHLGTHGYFKRPDAAPHPSSAAEVQPLYAHPEDAPKERPATKMERVVGDALECDGAHHKQWYLEQLADLLGVPVNERKGIAP